jgi:amino acid transporter
MLEGFFASVCAFSFAKMSRYHNANQNGAAYVYTRSTFGKLTGLFVGFLQYVYIPFSLSYQIMNVMRGLFTAPFISSTSPVFLY